MTNRVDIEVTGSNKFDATNAAVKKQMKELQAEGAKTSASVKKLGTQLEAKPKLDGIKEADKAIKKLADTADEAFDKVKKKLEDGMGEAERERTIKIKAEVDKERFKSSMDGLGSLDFDFGKIGGGKIAAALGGAITKGVDLVQAGVKGAGSFVSGLSDGLKNQHPAVQAAVYGTLLVAAMTAGPFIGGVLAGGVVAAFGAGIAGIGIVAAAQSDRVRTTYQDLWDEIAAGAKSRSTIIEDVLVRTAQRAKTALSSISGVVERSFSAIAPGLESLLDGVLRSIQRFAPALEPLAQAASAVFADLGQRLPDILGGIADELTDLSVIVRASPEAFGDFVAVLGEVAEGVLYVTGVLAYLYKGTRDILDVITTPLEWVGLKEGGEAAGKVGDKMLALADVSGTANDKLAGLQQGFRDLADAEDDATKRGDAFLDIMNRLNGITPSFDEAMQDANDTVRGLIDNFANGVKAGEGFGNALLNADGTINTMTKNGSLLYDAISGLRENFADMAGATKELEAAGMSHEDAVKKVNDAMSVQYERLLGAAKGMGLNQDQMRELLRLYGLTPEQINTLMKLDDAAYRSQLEANLRPRTLYINAQLVNGIGVGAPKLNGPAQAHAFGGNVAKAAAGGSRNNDVIMNDGPGFPGEAVRLPNGSTVWPAGMSREMMKQGARGFAMSGGGGGGGSIVVRGGASYGLEAIFIDWLKKAVDDRGGDSSVFG